MALKEKSVLYKVNQESYAILFAAVREGPKDTSQLCELTGLSRVVVQNIGRVFVKYGLFHVGSWSADARGVHRLPVWHWGPGEEAPRRAPKTYAEKARDSRLRKKQVQPGGVANAVFAGLVAGFNKSSK